MPVLEAILCCGLDWCAVVVILTLALDSSLRVESTTDTILAVELREDVVSV